MIGMVNQAPPPTTCRSRTRLLAQGVLSLVLVVAIFFLRKKFDSDMTSLELVTGLVGAGGDPDEVAAAVLIYRALTWALPILVGIGCYRWWRRQSLTASPQEAQRAAWARRP
jgi:hypothetical protein